MQQQSNSTLTRGENIQVMPTQVIVTHNPAFARRRHTFVVATERFNQATQENQHFLGGLEQHRPQVLRQPVQDLVDPTRIEQVR